MLDRTARADAPTEPGSRPPDQFPAGRDDLRQRLDRLAGGHPSSAEYRSADRDRPGRANDVTGAADRRDEPERAPAGWQAPDVRDHPDRPDVSEIRLPDDRGRHILDGDGPDRAGGGHRHGAGRPGKTEFPSTWPDEVILPIVEEVARTPDSVERQRNGRWLATGERDGVEVITIVLSDGTIWTAWPQPGGAGVRQNPTEGAA